MIDRNEVLERLDADIQAAKFRMELVEIGLLRAAAELIRAGGWRPIAEAPEKTTLRVGMYINGVWFSPVCEYDKSIAIRHEYTHFLLLPAPPARKDSKAKNGEENDRQT